jgi:hypothetical protein
VWWLLSCGSFLSEEPDFHLLAQPLRAAQKIEFVFPASLETYQREHPELTPLRPVAFSARPGRPRAEEILCILATQLRSGAVFSFYYQELFLAAIHGNQVRHELACHRQCGAIGITFSLFGVVEQGQ